MTPITLTTDFGTTDPFVGIMKGVIATRAPQVAVVDLTHGIPPQAVLVGALVLRVARALPSLRVFVRAALASAVMLVLLIALADFHVLLRIALAIPAYFGLLYMVGGIDRQALTLLRRQE